MVHTSNAIITATLALSAAAPILAAPVGPRIDSGISSVNDSAPVPLPQALATDEAVAAPAPAPPHSSGVGDRVPATALNLTHYLFSRAGTASSFSSSDSPVYPNGRPLPPLPPSASALTNGRPLSPLSPSGSSASLPPAPPPSPLSPSVSSASLSPSGSSTSLSSSDSSTSLSPSGSGSSASLPPAPPAPPLSHSDSSAVLPPTSPAQPAGVLGPLPVALTDKPLPSLPSATGWSSPLSTIAAEWSKSSSVAKAALVTAGASLAVAVAAPVAQAAIHRDLDADEMNLEARGVTPMDGPAFRQPTSSLALAGRGTAILASILSAAHRRDLDADTLRLLLGRDLEDLFAPSFGIDELD